MNALLPVPTRAARKWTGGILCASLFASSLAQAGSVARTWNEQNLAAIRIDLPHPPAHARNLFHTSVAMWDAWAAYDPVAVGYLHNEEAVAPGGDVEAARHEAISYAAFRLLRFRYQNSVSAATTAAVLIAQMVSFGYDPDEDTVVGDSPAAVGNRVAAAILAFAATDSSNELNDYEDPTYIASNDPLPLEEPGFTLVTIFDPNRWQPISFGEWAADAERLPDRPDPGILGFPLEGRPAVCPAPRRTLGSLLRPRAAAAADGEQGRERPRLQRQHRRGAPVQLLPRPDRPGGVQHLARGVGQQHARRERWHRPRAEPGHRSSVPRQFRQARRLRARARRVSGQTAPIPRRRRGTGTCWPTRSPTTR